MNVVYKVGYSSQYKYYWLFASLMLVFQIFCPMKIIQFQYYVLPNMEIKNINTMKSGIHIILLPIDSVVTSSCRVVAIADNYYLLYIACYHIHIKGPCFFYEELCCPITF